MPRNQKLSTEEKVRLVRRCLAGELSIRGAAQEVGVGSSSVHRWIIAYESHRAEELLAEGKKCENTAKIMEKAGKE